MRAICLACTIIIKDRNGFLEVLVSYNCRWFSLQITQWEPWASLCKWGNLSSSSDGPQGRGSLTADPLQLLQSHRTSEAGKEPQHHPVQPLSNAHPVSSPSPECHMHPAFPWHLPGQPLPVLTPIPCPDPPCVQPELSAQPQAVSPVLSLVADPPGHSLCQAEISAAA